MTAGQQFGWILTAAVAIMILLGPFVSQRDRMPAAQEAADSPLKPSAVSTLAELEVASQQALEQAEKVSPEEAVKLIEEVLDGAEANFALAQFDAWLEALETGKINLSQKDLEADLNELIGFAREVGVAENEILRRTERLDRLQFSNRL